jgi:hypothetical protein
MRREGLASIATPQVNAPPRLANDIGRKRQRREAVHIHRHLRCSGFAVLLILAALSIPAYATEPSQLADSLMRLQLNALKTGDYAGFIEHGNQAFKQMMDSYAFDSLKMQRQEKLSRGYRLEYLGTIHRLGLLEHLWKVYITDYRYELLGSLSISHEKIVGFDLY